MSEADSGRGRKSTWFNWLNREIAKTLACEGPDEAIEALYYLGGDGLLRYIKSAAGERLDHEDCEEVLMDLHLKLWMFFCSNNFEPTEAPLAIVAIMAKHLMIDAMRRKGRRPRTTSQEGMIPPVSSHPAVQDAVECEVMEEFELVQEFIEELPERQKHVAKRYLELYCGSFEGSIHNQIAEELDITPEASKRAWAVVLTKLRLHLDLPLD